MMDLKKTDMRRIHVTVRGVVQGVGFRPYVYRLAHELSLTGWVRNDPGGVVLEAQGSASAVESFLVRLPREAPERAVVREFRPQFCATVEETDFQIFDSALADIKTAGIPADTAACADCLREVFDPADRRYLYPFANCTQCGPRFSIINGIPYDRPRTTMAGFTMCPACQREYDDPADRRFHAQPNACPVCGPSAALWDESGQVLASGPEALTAAALALRDGKIVAVKGLGGFHLMADAGREDVVQTLRQRKAREEKPLAVMAPDLERIRTFCVVSSQEEALLTSPEAPIVLLARRAGVTAGVAEAVAPGNPALGMMLPYTPLHHILLRAVNRPLVATSGNSSDEPICTDEHEALRRLSGIADVFLVHNRPIARPVDDSVARVMAGRPVLLRRSRGYAPLPVSVPGVPPGILAVGVHLKNTVAVTVEGQVLLSQHIGDLETPAALAAFQATVADLPRLYEVEVRRVAVDRHPQYLSSVEARTLDRPVTEVQHHFAHMAGCLAENAVEPPAFGICWDGTGLGEDGTVWGGEFLTLTPEGFRRVGHLRPFRLPGGDTAAREPRRSALGLLFEMGMPLDTLKDFPLGTAFTRAELNAMTGMLVKGVNAPWTSSMGRLFDAAAALMGLRQISRFEGQAAMEVEFAVDAGEQNAYPIRLAPVRAGGRADGFIVDWAETLSALITDVRSGCPAGHMAARFHHALVEAAVAAAQRAGYPVVALSGGCFQNRYLTERLITRLREEGFQPCWHQHVPPNDGGLALGQIAALRWSGNY